MNRCGTLNAALRSRIRGTCGSFERPSRGEYQAVARAEAKVATQGGEVVVVIEETYAGEVKDGTLVLAGQKKAIKNTTAGTSQDAPPDTLKIQFDGADLVGKIGTDAAGWQDFRLTRKRP